jgi:hypothetical protein
VLMMTLATTGLSPVREEGVPTGTDDAGV